MGSRDPQAERESWPLQSVMKLIYQVCSMLRAALGAPLIRDIDGLRYNGSIYGFGYDNDNDGPR
jgi:hypothetical protein